MTLRAFLNWDGWFWIETAIVIYLWLRVTAHLARRVDDRG